MRCGSPLIGCAPLPARTSEREAGNLANVNKGRLIGGSEWPFRGARSVQPRTLHPIYLANPTAAFPRTSFTPIFAHYAATLFPFPLTVQALFIALTSRPPGGNFSARLPTLVAARAPSCLKKCNSFESRDLAACLCYPRCTSPARMMARSSCESHDAHAHTLMHIRCVPLFCACLCGS